MLGYLYLFLAQFSIAGNVVIGKYLNWKIHPMLFVSGRFVFSSLFLAAIMLIKKVPLKDPEGHQHLTLRHWAYLFLQGICGGFLFNYFFFTGLQYTTATSASIISSVYPAILAVLAVFFLGEKLGQRKILALVVSICGIVILALDNQRGAIPNAPRGSFIGDFLVFMAMIPEAFFSIFSKKIKGKFTLLGQAFVSNILVVILMLPISLIVINDTMEQQLINTLTVSLVGLSGITGVMFFYFWPKGLETIPANTAGLFGGVVPIGATLLAIIFLGESFSLKSDGVGMFMVMLSLYIGATTKRKKRRKKKKGEY